MGKDHDPTCNSVTNGVRNTVRKTGCYIPSDTELAEVLEVYAADDGPHDIFDVAHRVAPPPTKLDGRTRETKAWRERLLTLLRAQSEAYELGLLAETVLADGENPSLLSITKAGRAWLGWSRGRADREV